MSDKHPQKTITLGDQSAEVDEDLAELILNCWRLDIDTVMSCQNNVPVGWVWIEFVSAMDASIFTSIVAGKYSDDPKSLYQRIVNPGNPDFDDEDDEEDTGWKYRLSPSDWDVEGHESDDGEEWIETPIDDEPDIRFYVSVRFPRTDLEEVATKLDLRVKGN